MLQFISPLISEVMNGDNTLNDANATSPVAPSHSQALPTELTSLIGMLVSWSAVRDWLKLFVIGGLFAAFRRILFGSWEALVNSFFVTASFREDDDSYDWMMLWLSKHPSWSSVREVEISTRSFGLDSHASIVPGEDIDGISPSGERKLAYLPSISTQHTFWYKRRRVTVSRRKANTGYYGRAEETLEICIMSRDHKILNSLLLEAKKAYKALEENNISIYVSDNTNDWRHVASRPKRPLRSIVLDPGVKEQLIEDARDFLESKEWYVERGIPFRRGYLLYGAPGSGKTSIIHSLAGELGLDVYVISLSRTGMDDSSLCTLISDLPEKCIAIMEDIDAAFHQGLTRETSAPTPAGSKDGVPPTNASANPSAPPPLTPPPASRVTLSGLLNALDGIGAQEGRILYATTNKYHALDPALTRPGRMDKHFEFKLASKYQAAELFKCFYLPTGVSIDQLDDDDGSEDGSVDSGYGPDENEKNAPLRSGSGDRSHSRSRPRSATHRQKGEDEPLLSERHDHRDGYRKPLSPRLSRHQALDLSSRFADAIPDRQFSMASIQGYLMSYKIQPFEAADKAFEWVERERADREEKRKAATGTSTSSAS